MSIMTRNMKVTRVDIAEAHRVRAEDVVARDVPLHTFVNGVHFVSFLCSPTLLKELAVGHLVCEGLIDSVEEILKADFDGENRCFVTLSKTEGAERVAISKPFSRLIVSACGSISHRSISELLDSTELQPLPRWVVEAKTVLECVRRLNTLAETFRRTGGVHGAALFRRDGTLVAFAEDVGRHNAVDKAVGLASLDGQDLNECFLASSGRLTGDIVLKAARVGVPLVASLAAAIDSGVEVAEKANLTLVGFVRGKRMIVYTCPRRIKP